MSNRQLLCKNVKKYNTLFAYMYECQVDYYISNEDKLSMRHI